MAIPDLFEIRMGTESTDAWGTAVAQSVKLMGITDITLTPVVESVQIKDKRGSMRPGHVSVPQMIYGTGSLSGIALYDDLPYWLDSIFGAASPVTSTDVYQYDYVGAHATEPVISHYTLAYGDGTYIESLLGSTVQSLNISGASGEPLTFSANLIGKIIDSDTFDSAAEADRTVYPIMGDHVALWIDPSSDAVGTTSVTVPFQFSLDINTNRTLKTHLGNLNPTKYREARHEGALKLTLELDSDTVGTLDAILNTASSVTVERVVRIKASATVGALPNYLQVDFNGVTLEAPQLYTDVDGITTYEMTLMGQYNGTLDDWIVIQVQNGVSALA